MFGGGRCWIRVLKVGSSSGRVCFRVVKVYLGVLGIVQVADKIF